MGVVEVHVQKGGANQGNGAAVAIHARQAGPGAGVHPPNAVPTPVGVDDHVLGGVQRATEDLAGHDVPPVGGEQLEPLPKGVDVDHHLGLGVGVHPGLGPGELRLFPL